jgi:hypothetical protein
LSHRFSSPNSTKLRFKYMIALFRKTSAVWTASPDKKQGI